MKKSGNQVTTIEWENMREEVFSRASRDAEFKARLLSNPEKVLEESYGISSSEKVKDILGGSVFFSSIEKDLEHLTDELRSVPSEADTKKTKRIFCCS